MKKFVLVILSFFLFVTSGFSQTTLAQESFESPTGDYGYTSNTGGSCGPGDSPSDFFIRVTSTPTCFQNDIDGSADGNAWWASEDLDGAVSSGTEGLITLNSIPVAGYSALQVKVAFADSRAGQTRWESTDQIYVEYNMDNSGWTAIGLFRGAAPTTDAFTDTDLTLDSDNNPSTPSGTLSGPTVPATFTDYTFDVPVTGSSLQVRIRYVQNGGSEELGMDNIRVTGTFSTNVAPVLANIEGSDINYNEGASATQVTNTITVTDTDDTDMESATVSIITGFDGSEDVLAFTTAGGITGSFSTATGILSLSGTSSLANYQTVLRSVTYQNTDAADASPATRTIQFQVNDGSDASNLASRNINIVTSVNPPVALPVCESFETNGEGTRYTSNTFDFRPAVNDFFVRSTLPVTGHNTTVTGLDGTYGWASENVRANGSAGTVTLSPFIGTGLADFDISILLAVSPSGSSGWETDDGVFVQYNMDGAAWTTVGAFYGTNPGTGSYGELVRDADLNGVADPGGAQLTSTLQNFSFTFSASGTNLNVRIVVDQDGGSEELVFDKICVSGTAGQIGPALAGIEGTTLKYTEGDPATQVTNTLVVSDPDDTNMESATVSVCEGYVSGEDVLAFTSSGGITGSFNTTTGILSLSGSASIADYQATLRSVTYQNTNTSNPAPADRKICFSVNDGDVESNQVSRFISVEDLLDPPACLPYAESFETDGEGTRYNSNTFDDNPECNFFLRTNTQPSCHADAASGIDGSYYWASEDVEGGSNGSVDGIVELLPLLASGYTGLQISVLLGVSNNAFGNRFETDDAITIQYNMDDGGWITVGEFFGDQEFGGHMRQDADLNGQADPGGAFLTSTMQDFAFSIPATGSDLKVRVKLDQKGGTEEIMFDNIRVAGTNTTPAITINTQPTDQTVCPNSSAQFSVSATGTDITYQWQENSGSGFSDLSDGGVYSGSASNTLSISAASASMNGNQYQVIISSPDACAQPVTSSTSTLFSADVTDPVAVGQNITVYLDAAGMATITAADVDAGSSDNCSIPSLTVSESSFNCNDTGINPVVLTVTDASGNTDMANTTVTIADTNSPVVITQNITVYLDASGNASITAADVDNSSYDACGITTLAINTSSFTCSDVGANPVTLTVTDNNSNSKSKEATVTVVDTVSPTVVTQNITVYLDASGNATITPYDIDNGSSDACGIFGQSLDVSSFTCADVGPNPAVLTVTDMNSNSKSKAATVTVVDTVSPTVVTQNISVYLDGSGNASITPSDVDGGSSDACDIFSSSLDVSSFTCANVGTNQTVLTVTDNNSNSRSKSATVMVIDTVSPVISCPGPQMVSADPGTCEGTVPNLVALSFASDNCGIASISQDIPAGTTFGSSNNDDLTVTLTATDVNGNTSSCEVVLTLEDAEPPELTVISTPITLWPPNHKYETIDLSQLIISVNDNCAGLTESDVYISKVTSDEDENGVGDGNTVDDIVIPDDCASVQLRRERNEYANGRVYTIHLALDDGNGNSATASCEIHVPVEKNGTSIDDGTVYEVECGSKASMLAGLGDPQLTNYPNPFSASTTISFTVTVEDRYVLKVYHSTGREIATLYDGNAEPGVQYTVDFDGYHLPGGIYIYHLQSDNGVNLVRKMINMK
jgi:hypothetical protein